MSDNFHLTVEEYSMINSQHKWLHQTLPADLKIEITGARDSVIQGEATVKEFMRYSKKLYKYCGGYRRPR